MGLNIDINCDMGESYGSFLVGNDAAIFPYITSCNVACGFHGGDPVQMEMTIQRALQYGVRIGAHPSYPDLWGFGRRKMDFTPDKLKAIIRYQVAALQGMAKAMGAEVVYVKPHGALYHDAATNPDGARAIVESITSLDKDLALMGLPGSAMEAAAQEKEVSFIAEAFADRRYQSNGVLVSRSADSAVITDPEEAAAQALSIVRDHRVQSIDGQWIPVHAQTICVHGDNPETPAVLEAIDKIFAQHGIQKKASS